MRRLDNRSRMSGDVHVRFCESLRGQFPWATLLIVTSDSPEVLITKVRPAIETFLQERGLLLSEEKTRITHIDDGFDFLGFNVRKYNGKLLIKPAKKSVKSLLDKIRQIVCSNLSSKTEHLIYQLNPVLRGWANYFRHQVSKDAFSYIAHQLFWILGRWMRAISLINCSGF